jgi:capsular exopolysaccharide synthesis family protein
MTDRSDTARPPEWLRPPTEQAGLSYYVEVLRERLVLIAAAVALALLAAGAYLATADNVYKAEADLLITPAPSDDELLATLGVLRASNDPTRDVETAARLVATTGVAERVQKELGLARSPTSLLNDVTAEPVAESAIVAVSAEAPTAQGAADLANAFAKEALADRTRKIHQRIDQILPQVESDLQAGNSGVVPGLSLREEAARLQFLRSAPDPTISIETQAVPPNTPASPKPKLTLAAAAIAGLILGIAGAFAAQTLDPRLRREGQLRSRYQLPILARVPKQPQSRRGGPLSPAAIAPPTREAYRTLRANVTAARRLRGEPQSILVTGSSPSEGKTTTAINLAASLAMAGSRTILIEADLRRPAIGSTLGISVERGVVSALLENASLEESLSTASPFGPHLQLLLADYEGGWISELFSLDAAQRLVEEAKSLADFVVIDSPPLTAVVDTLPLARQADDVVIVSRLGLTRLDKLHELAELLAANGITPRGFALIGTSHPERSYSYYAGAEPPGTGRATTMPAPEPRSERVRVGRGPST